MKTDFKIKEFLLRLINISHYIDIPAAITNIRNNIYFRGPNVWILAFSIVIASVGLNVNSTAVIIGAMLISPLMGPIFGVGLGLGINDTRLIRASLKNLAVMIAISIVASCLYFLISPLDLDNPTELLSRTNPTIYDVLIALFGGFAGIFEIARKEKGTVFSGVAIATALMPPLCTAGYGIASGNILYFLGAFYLFFINCAFITLATYFSVRYMNFPSVKFADPATKRKTQRLISVVVVILIVPSVWSAVSVIKQNRFNTSANAFLEETKTLTKNYVYSHKIQHHKGSKLEIFVAGAPLTTAEKETLFKMAANYGIERDQLKITQNTADDGQTMASQDLIKGFYDITDNEIRKREQLIADLEQQLREIKKAEIDYSQVARELATQIPDMTSVAILKGAGMKASGFEPQDGIYILVSRSGNACADFDKIGKWLGVRLGSDNVKIIAVKDGEI